MRQFQCLDRRVGAKKGVVPHGRRNSVSPPDASCGNLARIYSMSGASADRYIGNGLEPFPNPHHAGAWSTAVCLFQLPICNSDRASTMTAEAKL